MISEQLSLGLHMPWNGYSPRSLCKINATRKLANEGASRLIQDGPVVQLELFPEGTSYGT